MIQLNENYRIKSDKYCWILEIRHDGKTSKGEHKDVWTQHYHPSFESIAKRLVQEEAKLGESLQGVVETLQTTAKQIEESIKRVG